MELAHRSVLLEPTIAALVNPTFSARKGGARLSTEKASGVYVDATFGRGGHSRALLQCLTADSQLYVIDKDPQAIAVAHELAAADPRVHVIHAGFVSIADALRERGVSEVDGVMMDLGVSSPQLDDAERGFSFMRDGPLDMRMNNADGPTAAEWLAVADVNEIKEVIADYGEERYAFQIAKAITTRRESVPLRTTSDLAQLVASVVRTREKGHHPATRTFQAIRIYLNRELEELTHALPLIVELLKTGGRMAVISFHSLEDRIVKHFMAAAALPAMGHAHLPIPDKDLPQPWLTLLGRILPTAEDIAENVRARSAILRVAQRTDTPLASDWQAEVERLQQVSVASGDTSRRGRRR